MSSRLRRTLLQSAALLSALPLLRATAASAPGSRSPLPMREVQASAPFDMPPIRVPDFADAPRFDIRRYGAAAGDKAATTKAIAAAISAANAAGGGRVIVPRGTWLTGAVHLKSNVGLHVEEGAVLLFSGQPEDYLPAVMTSWEGIECYNYSPLVYAFDCDNVALTGKGTLKAELDVWRLWYARPKPHMEALVALYQHAVHNVPVSQRQMARGEAHLRPQFVQFNRCRNVLIEDITIRDSPFWTVHPYMCQDVVIRRVDIRAHGHNNDGVDPEMSQNVLIEDCIFDQGDDAISVKSGREFDGWRLASPAKNIVIRNCRIKNGHQLLAIGSELSGGVENILVENCHFDRGDADGPVKGTTLVEINNILYVKTNERRGGYVRNIHMRNVTATSIAGGPVCVETDVLYQWRNLVPTYERRLTPIDGLYVSDVRVAEARFVCRIQGDVDLPVRNVTLQGVKVGKVRDQAFNVSNVEGLVNT